MARQTKEERLADIHAQALVEFDAIQEAQRDERQQCLEDRRFYSIAGAQWEGELGDQFENKPRFEMNRTHLAVLRIINEYRNNRVTVDFTAKDGTPNDTMADTCDGLYRADEKASGREPYDNAFEESTSGGVGAWRLRTCYEDENDDEDTRQRVRLEPIHDADTTVFFDLGAKSQDKGDAKRCYVLNPYTHDDYIDEFDDDPSTWDRSITNTQFDWLTPETVWVCEHYRIEEKTEMVYWFRSVLLADAGEESELRVTQAEIDADPEKLDQLKATGYVESRHKRVKTRKVHKYLLSGSKVLEDCGYIAGTEIPIVITYGKRWVIDGIERCMGHVRLAKDAQRLTNMLMSWLAEITARFDIEKPIFAPEQVVKFATMWAEDNVKKFPYLLADLVKGPDGTPIQTGPIGYTKAPTIPQPMAALLEIATQALNDLLGGQQAGEQLQPNLSGKAVELIQTRLDMQTFIYMDNLAQYAMRRSGIIWLAMMRDIVVEDSRRMKTIAADGKAGSVVVNQPKVNADTGESYVENDLSKATFDVDVDVGPSSSSKRAATVRALSGLASITDDPDIKQALTFAIITNIEGEGLGDLNEWGRARSIRAGITKPTDEEKAQLEKEQAAQPPDPQAAYLMAEAGRSQANTALALANTEKAKAETAKTLAETGTERLGQAIDAANALGGAVSQPATVRTPAPKSTTF